jgi:hypothetical protein
MLSFEDGAGQFHIPYRCDRIARKELNGLCERCSEKERKTAEKVEEISGKARTTMSGMLPSYLHGRVTDPIPFWSRLYDGAWYRLKIESGCKVSEETMAKVKKAVAEAYAGIQTAVEPEPMPVKKPVRQYMRKKAEAVTTENSGVPEPESKKRPGPKKKEPVAPAPATPAPAPATPAPAPATPAPAPATPAPAPVPQAKKRIAPKKAAATCTVENEPASAETVPSPVAMIQEQFSETVEDVLTIRVIPKEIGGRKVYLEPKKQKVYDLKFNYIGRHNTKEDTITSFPDSDAED